MPIPTFRNILSFLICIGVSSAARAAEQSPIDIIRADQSLLVAPKTFPADEFKSKDPAIRALFIEAKPFQGKPTRAFAWIGVPKVEPGQKVPGMVLVHGGGGTAFESWVKLWVSRGYAAIAVDTCGQVPSGTYGKWKRHENAGPLGWDETFKQINDPMTDQWPYHAVCDAMLAHSLLRAQEGVDPERIGETGISWGGYLTGLIAGADPRYKLAVPVYGCGYIDECVWSPTLEKMPAADRQKWIDWWDPRGWLKSAKMPMLWVTGTNDFAYVFPALQKSYRLPQGERTLCIRLRMQHGHGAAGEGPLEIAAFADSILKQGDGQGPGLPKITGSGRSENNGAQTAWATFTAKSAIKGAELLSTKETGPWQKRVWNATPAKVGDDYRITAMLPEGTKVYYLNVIDEHGNVVSSEHEELP